MEVTVTLLMRNTQVARWIFLTWLETVGVLAVITIPKPVSGMEVTAWKRRNDF